MKIVVKSSSEELSNLISKRIIDLINNKPDCHLGLATGSSPIGVYDNLIKAYKEGLVSFKEVKTFNLDEYINYPEEKDSYHYFMKDHLFNHIDINLDNTHFPNEKDPEAYDKEIEKAGGVDLQILGIGADGHIGFNEPNTPFESHTHITELEQKTISDNARFFKRIEDVPTTAVTMGLDTIMHAKEIILIATGKNKAEAIKKLLAGEDITCPASILNRHPNVTLYLDEACSPLINA